MNNISKLKNYIFSSCTIFNSANTVFINSYGTGESDDVAISGSDLYPRVFIEQPFEVYQKGNITEYQIHLLVMDKYNIEEDNLAVKQDLTYEILCHLLEKFKRDDAYVIDDSNIVMASHTAYNDDITAAWRAEFTLIEATPAPKDNCNKNYFGNCYESVYPIDIGFESTSHLMSVTLGEGYFSPTPGSLTFDNLPAIETYLNSIVDTGEWSVYFDADNNLHFKLNHYHLTPLIIRIFLSGYGFSLELNFQTIPCTLD